MSPQFRTNKQSCAKEGSTEVLRYITDLSLCHNEAEIDFLNTKNTRKVSTFTIHVDITPACKGFIAYDLSYYYTGIVLNVASK